MSSPELGVRACGRPLPAPKMHSIFVESIVLGAWPRSCSLKQNGRLVLHGEISGGHMFGPTAAAAYVGWVRPASRTQESPSSSPRALRGAPRARVGLALRKALSEFCTTVSGGYLPPAGFLSRAASASRAPYNLTRSRRVRS